MKERLLDKQKNAWRGYVQLSDFEEYLIDAGFPKIKKEQTLDFIKYLDLYN
jgi:hypothetical protein